MSHVKGSSGTTQKAWSVLWERPGGRWPSVRWGLALLLPVALLLWGVSLVFAPQTPRLLTIRVESQVSGERLSGATVYVGDVRYVSDEQGEIRIQPVAAGTMLRASADGHQSMRREVLAPDTGTLTLSLPGVLVVGKLVDAVSDRPIEGASVTVVSPEGTVGASAHSDAQGNFIFKFIPEQAEILVEDELYGESVHSIEEQWALLIALDPPPVTGRVLDGSGRPMAGVDVLGGESPAVSDADGRFTVHGVAQGGTITLRHSQSERIVVVEGVDLGDLGIGPFATPEVDAR